MPLAMSKPTARLGRIAILWRGDAAARHSATPQTSRFKAIFAALADVGVDAEPVVYEDDVLDAIAREDGRERPDGARATPVLSTGYPVTP